MSTTQHRTPRLLVGIFLPAVVFAFITSTLVALGVSLPHFPAAFGSVTGLIGLILSGWIMGGVQSIIYSILVEFVVNPEVKNKRQVIIISGLLIAISTWVIVRGFPISLLAIGFTSGCVVGAILRDLYKHYA